MLYGFEKYAEAKDWFFKDCPYCHDNCEVQVESGIEEVDGEEYEVFMVVCNACDYTTEAYGDESEAVDAWNSGKHFRDWMELPNAQECSPSMDREFIFEEMQLRADARAYEEAETRGKALAKGEIF